MSEQPPKKRPGRPKKFKSIVIPPPEGKCETPVNGDHSVELISYYPAMFKKIVALFGKYGADIVDFDFDERGMTMSSRDRLNKVVAVVFVSAIHSNRYYCAVPKRVSVSQKILENVFTWTTKQQEFETVFSLKWADQNRNMHIVVKNPDISHSGVYRIDTTTNTHDTPIILPNDTVYPVKFKISSKDLKTLISGASKISDSISIQTTGKALQIEAKNAKSGVMSTNVYDDPAKIDFQCTIEPDSVFTTTAHLSTIQPFSSIIFGDEVAIAASTDDKLSMMTRVNLKDSNGKTNADKWMCEVKVYVDVVRNV